jgi:ribonuclease D
MSNSTITQHLQKQQLAFLFHGTIDREDGQRQVLISIYADGLPMTEGRRPGALYMYRPWFCRERESTEAQETAIKAIQALIDQPSRCIRDTDCLDLERLETKVESGPLHDNLLLVNSLASIRQMQHEWKEYPPTIIAFDLEAYNESKYCQLTCLLQIAVPSHDHPHQRHYIIDPLAPEVWDEIGPTLAPYFADPSIVKIGHAIGGLDVPCLYRDFGIVVVNAFDTYEAATQLRLPLKGLAAVCDHYQLLVDGDYYQSLKDQYQSCDWRVRPLTGPMVQYGRFDIHYLMPLRELMIRDLTRDAWASDHQQSQLVAKALQETLQQFAREDGEDDFLASARTSPSSYTTGRNNDGEDTVGYQSALSRQSSLSEYDTPAEDGSLVSNYTRKSECVANVVPRKQLNASELRMQIELGRTMAMSQEHCRKLWRGRSEPRMGFLDLMVQRLRRHQIPWTSSQNELYMQLADWRDAIASALETLPQFIAPLEFLAAVAYQRPCTEIGLRRISSSLPHAIEENKEVREQLLDIVRESSCTKESKEFFHEEYYFYKVNKFRRLVDEGILVQWKWSIAVAVVLAGAAVVVSGRKRSR